MRYPNFLIIGAQKCGTTWLSVMLREHPEVAAPKKELHFFNYKFDLGADWYHKQFPDIKGSYRIGEFTPNYFWTSDDPSGDSPPNSHFRVPERVKQYYPDMKLILILRDPVARAVSAYYHHIRDRSLSPLTPLYSARCHRGILSMGFYDVHLSNWLKHFSRDQILILFFENDIVANKNDTLRRVCSFLDISTEFSFPNLHSTYNQRASHLYMLSNYYFPEFTRKYFWHFSALERFGFPKIKVKEKDLEKLREIYHSHNVRLSAILDRSLPWQK